MRGLLSRLETGDRDIEMVTSVVAHLRVLLNSRAGGALTVPDFGVVDFTDIVHEVPQGVRQLQQVLRDVIQKYEPRLLQVSVRFVPSTEPLRLAFEVVGRLDDGRRSLLRLRTHLTADRTFHVA